MATSPGAGQKMGLSVVLNAEKNSYFMTSAFFEGFKVKKYIFINNYCNKTKIICLFICTFSLF